MLAYAQCMRANGVPDFPDPDANGNIKLTSRKSANGQTSGIDPSSSAFKNAQRTCQAKLPADVKARGAAAEKALQTQLLAYAQCMRANGIPDFPDPEIFPDGRMLMKMPKNVQADSQAFKAAQAACASKLPGKGPGGGGGVGVGG